MQKEQNEYELKFNRTILLQFANTFNDSNAALAELIANSYDAIASKVEIHINTIDKILLIFDDGIGMNKKDINDKFLDIGDNKRRDEAYSKNKRKIMGRKGSGRLGVFSFANKMNVTSKKKNEEICNVILDFKELVNNRESEPYSREINFKFSIENGTIIELSEIEADLDFIFKNLSKYLSVHFSHVIENKDDPFTISLFIDNVEKPIIKKPEIFNKLDRFVPLDFSKDELKKWKKIISTVKEADLPVDQNDLENGYNPNLKKYKDDRIILKNEENIEEYNKGKSIHNKLIIPPWKVECKNLKQQRQKIDFNITGWIGTLSSIEDKDGMEANIVNHGLIVYARNRVVVANLIKDIKTDRFYQSYIVGEIFAEDLDNDELIDIINISRDNFSDQDERYPKLKQQILAWVNLLIHEKEKIKKIKKELKNKIVKKTTNNIISKLKRKGIDEETIVKQIAPVFAKETGYKMTYIDPIIFISFMSKEKSPKSFYISDIIYKIFKVGLKINDYNTTLIYTGSIDDGVPYGENIMDYLKANALAVNLENVAFIACIADNYVENWYTAVEYGASWATGKRQFILIDDKATTKKFDPPLSSLAYFDFQPLFTGKWKNDLKLEFVKKVSKLVKDILNVLKLKSTYSDEQINKVVIEICSNNIFNISVSVPNQEIAKKEEIKFEDIKPTLNVDLSIDN